MTISCREWSPACEPASFGNNENHTNYVMVLNSKLYSESNTIPQQSDRLCGSLEILV